MSYLSLKLSDVWTDLEGGGGGGGARLFFGFPLDDVTARLGVDDMMRLLWRRTGEKPRSGERSPWVSFINTCSLWLWLYLIDIESLQNRLLKVCYVPATSASLPRVSFIFSFLFLLLRPLTVLMKQTRWLKQFIFFDVYALSSYRRQYSKTKNIFCNLIKHHTQHFYHQPCLIKLVLLIIFCK